MPYASSMRRLLLLLILLIPACARPADHARVIGVSDGDTLTVLSGKTQTRIRLHGIDAPETGQDYGSRAKQVAADLAFGKEITRGVRVYAASESNWRGS